MAVVSITNSSVAIAADFVTVSEPESKIGDDASNGKMSLHNLTTSLGQTFSSGKILDSLAGETYDARAGGPIRRVQLVYYSRPGKPERSFQDARPLKA
jgi:hypothetical protein